MRILFIMSFLFFLAVIFIGHLCTLKLPHHRLLLDYKLKYEDKYKKSFLKSTLFLGKC